jgi:hypothetical protein
MIPKNPEALLTRDQTADALTEAGFPVSSKTLSTKATRGGGPPFRKFGTRAIYEWGTSLQWARDRLRGPVRSTSETDASRAKHVSPGKLLVYSSQPFVDAAHVPEDPAAILEVKHEKAPPPATGRVLQGAAPSGPPSPRKRGRPAKVRPAPAAVR